MYQSIIKKVRGSDSKVNEAEQDEGRQQSAVNIVRVNSQRSVSLRESSPVQDNGMVVGQQSKSQCVSVSVLVSKPDSNQEEQAEEDEDYIVTDGSHKVNAEFVRVLKSSSGRGLFKEHLHRVYAAENIDFYLECRELGRIEAESEFVQKARHIYDRFISSEAEHELNISGLMKEQVVNDLIQAPPNRHMFRPIQEHIFKLMEKSLFARFRATKEYEQWIIQQKNRTQ